MLLPPVPGCTITTWLADGANTAGMPRASAPGASGSVEECEQADFARASTHTWVRPLLLMSYAATRSPFEVATALPPVENEGPIENGLSSGCGSPLMPFKPTADAAPPRLARHSAPAEARTTADRRLNRCM